MPEKDTILVRAIVGSNLDHEDGRRLYAAVDKSFQAGKNVELDMHGLDIITPSLLNTSFRELTKKYGSDHIKEKTTVVNSNKLINDMLREAVSPERAQQRSLTEDLQLRAKAKDKQHGRDSDRER